MTNLSVPSIKEAEAIAAQWTNIFSTFYQDTHYDIITTERRNDVASQKTTELPQEEERQALKELFDVLDKIKPENYHHLHFQVFCAKHYEREFFIFVQQGVPIEQDSAATFAFKSWSHKHCGGWEFTPRPFQREMLLIDNLALQRLKQFSQIMQSSNSQRTKV